jgi:acyl-CoA synthetase (AMP-forming)/AMP-acid ligase II
VFNSVGALNILITNPRDLPGFVKELKKWKFSAFTGVNTLFNGLLNNDEFKTIDFSSLKVTLGGGMAVQKAVAEKWKALTKKPLIEAYGLTETSPAACINPMSLKEYNGFIGVPIPSTEVEIKDEKDVEMLIQKATDENWMRQDLGSPGDMGRRDLENRLRKLQGLPPLYNNKFYEPSLEEVQKNFEEIKKGSPSFSPRQTKQVSFNDEVTRLMEQTSRQVNLENRHGKYSDWDQIELEKRLAHLKGETPNYHVNTGYSPTLDELHELFDEAKGKKHTKRRKDKRKVKTYNKKKRGKGRTHTRK